MIVNNPEDKITFEEAMNSLKQVAYDEFKAVEVLKKKRQQDAQDFINITKS